MTPHPPSDWHHLAEQASREMDPKRLVQLVSELNRLLGERGASTRQKQ
jgi:hypothetical protein